MPKVTRWAAAALLLAVVPAVIGCRDRPAGTEPGPSPGAGKPGPSQDAPAWIKADPNPVAVEGDKGSTTISWDTGTRTMAQVYMSTAGKPEQLFAGGSRGSQKANWINKGRKYEFILYAGKEREKEVARVTVTTK
jgi:hypothetical protein